VQAYSTAPVGAATVLIDDVTLTQDAWVETIAPVPTPQNGVSDAVVRSQSGRILQNTLTDGPTPAVSSCTYDAAGRLTAATIPRHQLTYEYAASGRCGLDTRAGLTAITLAPRIARMPRPRW